MIHGTQSLAAFNELVATKYQLYNGLFLTLPFAKLRQINAELPLFTDLSHKQLQLGQSPETIVNNFLQETAQAHTLKQKSEVLFLMLQFIERQVVLFDALENAAFPFVHDMSGRGSVANMLNRTHSKNKQQHLQKLLQTFRTRIVLTAHPTQFYPQQVLGIIDDLSVAISYNRLQDISDLLLQLGKTSFKSQHKPTPFDEAEALLHHMENVLYPVITDIYFTLSKDALQNSANKHLPNVIELGFWPGGDRDGNPFVTADITLKVAKRLKEKIIRLYLNDLKQLKRRLTFKNMWGQLEQIRRRLKASERALMGHYNGFAKPYDNSQQLLTDLKKIKQHLIKQHNALFVDDIDKVISAIISFGFYFATIDLRQDSRIHSNVIDNILRHCKKINSYASSTADEKLQTLIKLLNKPKITLPKKLLTSDHIIDDCIGSLKAAKTIQQENGEQGLNRYIISNTQDVYNVLEVMLLAHWAGLSMKQTPLDIVPLFETVDDLSNAATIMQQLYSIPLYKKHLQRRHNTQIIMLGFSDGTKDGGYVTANWSIFNCKKQLNEVAHRAGIKVIFFDGRGGPPARGGGDTHKFYRALQPALQQQQIQLTIQGQTITSNFGTKCSAKYNIEQLFTATLDVALFDPAQSQLSPKHIQLFEQLSEMSYKKYQHLKDHPSFIDYLENFSPLKFYKELNIASRPTSRKASKQLVFEDLRAISFVGAWTQLKQNILGYYGFGTALDALIKSGHKADLQKLYKESLFFRTLAANAMQSLLKSYFPLTEYLRKDKKLGKFWKLLYDETKLCENMLKQISQQKTLLENDPVIRKSIIMRDNLVLPLLVIQQYALISLRKEPNKSRKNALMYKNLILKSLAANINASRNAV